MFIRVDPNNSNPPNFDVIEINVSLPNLLANIIYNDCSAGPGMMNYIKATYKQSQYVTCNNLANNPLNTDIYEV